MFEALSIDQESVEDQEEALRLTIRGLAEDKKKLFHQAFSKRVKDPDTYAVLNFFFLAGLHHFYLSRPTRGSINLLTFALGLAMLFFGSETLGLALIATILLIEFPALFRAQTLVKQHNNHLSTELLSELDPASSPGPCKDN